MAVSFALALLISSPLQAATLDAIWNSAADVPVTAGSYDATGNSINLTLNFVPLAATNLTVVNNTGLNFITGAFSNLAQGQALELTFRRITYRFVANYYGGSGNDLVLQWADFRPMGWGSNHNGQLGNNAATSSPVTAPVAVLQSGVLAGKTIISIAAGGTHSLALCSDGTLASWGSNSSGMLGNGSITSKSLVPVAVRQDTGVLAGKTVIAIAAGGHHSLVLCSDGTLAAWGENSFGQLGNGNSPEDSDVPVAVRQSSGVLAGKSVISIAAGGTHSLVLCSDGTLVAWGNNTRGILGHNSTAIFSDVPVAVLQSSGVLFGKTVTMIAAGGFHSLVLCADGTLASWGQDDHGQLGNSSATDSKVPVAVQQTSGVLAGRTVIAAVAGGDHNLALCADNTVAAWGQLSISSSHVPVAVPQTSGALKDKTVATIAAGSGRSLVLCLDGTLAQSQSANAIDFSFSALSSTLLASGESFLTLGRGPVGGHALALVAAPPPLEAAVSGNGVNIADGDSTPQTADFTDFGSVPTGSGVLTRTFTISNTGTIPLTLGGITVSGAGAASFSVTTAPAAVVAVGGSTSFEVTFSPTTHGTYNAWLNFTYNDIPENPFNFCVEARGVNAAPTAIALSATSIQENNTPSATVGTLSFTDANPGDLPAFSLASGTGSTDNASFSIDGNSLRLTPSGDFETKSSYAIRIRVADGQGGSFETTFTIAILDVPEPPLVATPTATGIAATAADLGGHVTSDGGAPILERGVVYSATEINPAPSIGGNGVTKVTAGGTTGVFTAPVMGLSPNTLYSFIAYATNAQGTTYTHVGNFGTGLTVTCTAASAAAVTAVNFTAGGSLTLALGYGPVTGSNLLLVENTGQDFITGTFSNLAQGQPVVLTFGAVTYHFVANYYGGSGNDLVLQWANVRPVTWGNNEVGQLGNNSTAKSTVPTAVIQSGVLAARTVIAVAAGDDHSLVLCSDGTLAAWGENGEGQLGNNSRVDSSVPVAVLQSSGVLAGKTVIAISAGERHSLALCSDGTLAAWGYNGQGQLGNNSATRSTVPVAVLQSSGVLAGRRVVAVSAAATHSLALCADGAVAAWGWNGNGQLGNNSTVQSSVPVAVLQSSGVLAGKTVIAVSASAYHNLALCSDGTLAAWGSNNRGQLGNNSGMDSTVPVAVLQSSGALAGKTVIRVSAGSYYSLALCADGTLAAWGWNAYGQLGNNSTAQSNVPVAVMQNNSVLGGKTVTAVEAGAYHSLALCSDGTLAAWGRNSDGQLGNNSTIQSTVPVGVSTTSLASAERFTAVATGTFDSSHTLALVAVPPPLEITVSGNGVEIADGDTTPSTPDFTDLGSIATNSGTVARTFTINNSGPTNPGTIPLTLGSVTVNGTHAADFTVTAQPAANVDIGGSTTFEVAFNPNANGLRSANLSFTYNGHDETPFDFSIQGTGLNSAPTAIGLSPTSIAENNAPDATVGTLSATDADPGDVPTFALVSGDGSTDNGSFSIAGTALRITPSADFEVKSSYAVRIGVNDGQGGTFESPFTITIIDGPDFAIVATPTVAGITANAAELGGNVIFDGGGAIMERGFVFSANTTNSDPVIGGNGVTKVTADGTTAVFAAPVTGLSANTLYSFRAYATNARGTSYGSVGTFSTTVTFTYTGAGNVPLTAANFNAGGAITLGLDYAPVTGTNLMVVNNTGPNPIQGTFSNLAQGQAVTLTFDGVIYHFVANYHGGSGNDLVLQWAKVRPMAWGINGSGQLGNNSTTQSNVPVAVLQSGVLSGKTVIEVTAGGVHSLALCADGTLAAWGYNGQGQLGNGSTTQSTVPVGVQSNGALSGKTVVAIAAGDRHSLALCADGTLVAWGQNEYGQLGDGSTTQSAVPVAVRSDGVLSGKKVIAIAAGQFHNLALCADGTLVSWGQNEYGRLGNNSTADSSVPVAVLQNSGVLSDKTVSAVAAGFYHSLALCTDGTLAAWGRGFEGQLGNNNTTDSSVPVAVRQSSGVLFGKTVIEITAGASHCLALCSDGTLAAWGRNDSGQLGNNSTAKSTVPVAVRQSSGVLFGKTVIEITAGQSYSLARCGDGTLAAWGYTDSASSVPLAVNTTTVAPGERFTTVSSGSSARHTLALVATPPLPDITVSGSGVDIAAGDGSPSSGDFTDFGNVPLADSQTTRSFTIANKGDTSLSLTSNPRVQISGPAAADFKITASPSSPLSLDATTDFAITFDPSLPGLRSALVTIASNDPVKSTFTFAIQGFGQLSKPLAQTITFTAPATVYLAQSPLWLSTTASSGLPVTLTVLSGPATLTGNGLTLTAAGTVKVQATQPGGGNYAAAKAVTVSIAVKANPTALTLTRLNQMYDGAPKPIETEGGEGEVQVTYTVNGASTDSPPTNAGSYAVKAVAGAVTKTGKLVIVKAPLYVTPEDRRKFAGQANPALSATYSGFMGADNESVMTKLPVLSTTAKTSSPGGAYPITAKGGVSANYLFVYRQGTLMVESFAGSYEALLTNGGGLPVGKLALTVPTAGQNFTGKLYTAEETAAVSLAGSLTTDAETELAAGQATAKVKGIPYAVSITLPLYGDVVSSVTRDGVLIGAASDGRKLLVLPTGGKVSYAGAHTVVLEPATPAGPTVPVGAGWATATVSNAGVLTLTGKLGDGTAFTTALAPDGDDDPGYRLFVQPYLPARAQSYLAGQFRLKAHPNVALPDRRYLEAANMTWTKAGKTADASYRAGFGPVTTVLTLDPWLAPSTQNPLAPLLGLGGSSFDVTHSTTGDPAHDESLPTSATLSATNTVAVLLPVDNRTKWKVTLTPKTGTFTGSFELREGTPAVKRTVPFTGILRQPPATPALPGTVIGDGHYLLPPLTGTEKVSGDVSFTRP